MAKHRSLVAGVIALALISLAIFMPSHGPVQAATFTVNSTGDQPDSYLPDGFCDTAHRPDLDPPIPPSGVCTLRAAIMQANAQPDPDTISFSIGGGGAQSITPFSRLPDLTGPVIIDGTTQPGFSGQPVIELNGGNVPFAVVGLSIASNSTVKGLAINRFGEAGLRVSGSNNVITGNYIGTDIAGAVASGNGRDQIGLGGIAVTGANNRIGGTDHDPGVCNRECNLVSANGNAGVLIDGAFGRDASGNRVLGNFIGTDITGATTDPDGVPGNGDELGNTVGVAMVGPGATGNLVGGTTPEARNLVAGSAFNHIRILGGPSGNTVQGNYLGTDITGTLPRGAGFSAVFIFDSADNIIGGTEDHPPEGSCPGVCNLIAASGVHGVLIESLFTGTTGNRVQGNYIGTNVNGDCELDSEGRCPLGNRGDGVRIRNASDSLIGGAGQGHGNLISGNRGDGVHIEGANSQGNRGQGNFIGLSLAGDAALPNGGVAVAVRDGATGTTIGGTQTGQGNRLYGGVFILGDATRGASVLGNELTMAEERSTGNALPIDLGGDGPSCNPWTGGAGPNAGIAPPRILNLATTAVAGRTSPGATVEAYRVLASGTDQGRYFPRNLVPLGFATAGAEGNFSVPVNVDFDTTVAVTATDTDGNTSELSQLRRPLILVPGIGGTWLDAADDTELWLPDGATDEAQNANLGRMALDTAGISLEPVTADRVLESHPLIFGAESTIFYGFIIDWLKKNGYPDSPGDTLQRDLWRFPYDWRLTAQRPADELRQLVDSLTENSPTGPIARSCEVDIVAHSMGGIVASAYIRSDEEHSRNHVHRLVTVGSPYLGTPQAAAAHTKGYIFGLEKEPLYGHIPYLKSLGQTFDVDWPLMLQMARNLTAAFTLLPSRAYFETTAPPQSAAYLQDLNGSGLESYDATFEFLTAPKFKIVQDNRPIGLARNGNLWDSEQQTVHDLIDDWRDWEGPPQVFRIVGNIPASTAVGWRWDPRLAQRWEANRNNFQRFLDRFRDLGRDIRKEERDSTRHVAYRSTQVPVLGPGDKTVALASSTLGRSATGLDRSGVDSAWIEEFEHYPCEHSELVTEQCQRVTGLSLAQVTDILHGGYRARATALVQSQAVQGQPEPAPVGWDVFYVSGAMPVTVHVTDISGNHTGPATPTSFSSIEYDVPGIAYYPNDFATSLALDRNETYTLAVEAPVDTALLEIVRIIPLDNGAYRNVLFPAQEVAIDGGLRLVLEAGERPESAPLEVDADGDGSYEGSLAPAVFLTSAFPAPAVPAPEPLSVRVTASADDTTDAQVEITLPDVGGPAWQWQADSSIPWISLDPAAGQTPDTLIATLASTSLPVGTHFGSVDISFSFDGYQLDYLVDITLEIVASGDEVCGDQNGDGVANVLDVIIDLQIAVELIQANADQRRLSDLNQDGAVNVFDAIRSLQHIVGQVEVTDCGPPET